MFAFFDLVEMPMARLRSHSHAYWKHGSRNLPWLSSLICLRYLPWLFSLIMPIIIDSVSLRFSPQICSQK